MKAANKLVVLLIVGVFSAVGAIASTPEAAYLETCRKAPGVPVPIAVVSPAVGSEHAGSSVQLEFVVDEKGRAVDISIKSTPDKDLAAAVVQAVRKWKFQPAESNGVPVATKVMLPVKIVEPVSAGSRFIATE